MDTWKKIVISYYMVLVSTTFTLVVLDGLGKIEFTEGNITLIITIFSVALAPVAISALKTKDFWKDDPESVRRVKIDHAKEISDLREEHSNDCETYQNTIEKYKDTVTIKEETIETQKEEKAYLLSKLKFGNRKPTTKPEKPIRRH